MTTTEMLKKLENLGATLLHQISPRSDADHDLHAVLKEIVPLLMKMIDPNYDPQYSAPKPAPGTPAAQAPADAVDIEQLIGQRVDARVDAAVNRGLAGVFAEIRKIGAMIQK